MSEGRPLTAGERALVASVFGGAIDPAPVRVHNRPWWPLQPRRVAMAPMGHLHFHPAGDLYRADFAAADFSAQALFVHEMVHVWQAQRSGRYWLPLMRHPFCRYDYALVPGKPFDRYGIEQQAEIVKHGWMLRRGIAVAGKPTLEAYETLLPFAAQSAMHKSLGGPA